MNIDERPRVLVWSAALATRIFGCSALCAAMGVGAQRVSADTRVDHGAGVSGISVTNVAAEPNVIDPRVDLFRQDGFGPVSETTTGTPSWFSWYVYFGGFDLERGIYDGIISADRHHRSSVDLTWFASGAAARYTSSTPAEEVLAPLVRVEPAGHRSLVTVQNTDRLTEIDFEIALFGMDGDGVASTASFTVAAGLSRTIDLSHEPAFEALREDHPGGFVGSARIRSSGAPVTAHVLTEGEPGSIGVYDYPVEPATDFARTLHIPRFRVMEPGLAGSAGTRSTSVTVGNPGNAAIEFVAEYTGTVGACAGRTVATGPHTLHPWTATILDSALDSGFGPGCSGYATLSSDRPMTGVVVDRTERPDRPITYSAHPAVSERDSSTRVVISDVRHRFLSPFEYTTEIVVTNPGSEPASVTLVPRTDSGMEMPCSACEFTLAPHESRGFEAAELGFPSGRQGSAMVRSDRPVAVIGHHVSFTGALDATAFRQHTRSGLVSSVRPTPGPDPAPTLEPGTGDEFLPLIVHDVEIFGPPDVPRCLYFPIALHGVRGGSTPSGPAQGPAD